ncbi:MAG: C39 family peptidase [Planctomycetaceae bacterium]|nr:C39 family peptidase [Planctomycetaceae bacterium]
MGHQIHLEIQRQPCNTTCGPTCLHALYRYYEDQVPLEQVIGEAPRLEEGGTLAVMLGGHALRRGYDVTICTFNLQVFDPTWFQRSGETRAGVNLAEKLQQQADAKPRTKTARASKAYIDFLSRGGRIRMEDLTASLLRRYLKQSIPLLTGLSATYLYHESREIGALSQPDDVRGDPSGHFVVLCGYDKEHRNVTIADPWLPNPISTDHHYSVDLDRVICSILLGIVTYDANLLIIQPRKQ